MNCHKCGSTGDEFGLMPVSDYDWTSTDDDALSIKRVVGHQCVNATQCARNVVKQGMNASALREIIREADSLPESIVVGASAVLGALSQIAHAIAKTEEVSLREAGFGAIRS